MIEKHLFNRTERIMKIALIATFQLFVSIALSQNKTYSITMNNNRLLLLPFRKSGFVAVI